MTTPDPDHRSLLEGLTGHRVRLTLTDGTVRVGTVIGAGPAGFQLASGIGGRMLFRYGDVDGVDDLGLPT